MAVRLADYVINRLVENKIDTIFMITGRGILYLTDAVAKNHNIKAVSTYHEQGASYAAMAYASAKEGMGACLVSTGCGATNAVTAALCAYQDNIPCIFISGQNMLNETTRHTGVSIRTYGSQEADIISVVKSITKYAVMIEEANDIAYEIDKAIRIAQEGRKGPVWIDIPLDIQNSRIEETKLRRDKLVYEKININIDDIEDIINNISNTRRPVLIIGGGVRSAGAIGELCKFVESNNIPLVFTTTAADTYGTDYELSIGALGSLGGSRAGNFAVQNSDYILAIGTKLCSQTVGTEKKWFARDARITVVDIDPNEHTKAGVKIDKLILADAKEFLSVLNTYKLCVQWNEWTDKCRYWKKLFSIDNEEFIVQQKNNNEIDIYSLSKKLSECISENTVVITDAGFEELIVPSTMCFGKYQRCLFPAAQGAMGYAIPAIIGAYYAGKENIVTVVGDGSIMMNLQELLTISAHRIPVKIIVINNYMYAVIRKRQKDLFRQRTIGNDPTDGVAAPNFEVIAKCFGFSYRCISNFEGLNNDLDKFLKEEGPCIIEVLSNAEQKYLHTSFTINDKRRLVKRPLEDLSPFIDRKLLVDEMIVEPIEE